MWPGLIQKAKDGGLDVIETYVFWDIHEPVRGQARTNTTPPTLPVMLLLFSSIFIVFVFFFTFPNHLLLLATIMCQTKGSGARPVFASSAPYALFSLFFLCSWLLCFPCRARYNYFSKSCYTPSLTGKW
jgi:hypothetical protein